MKNKLFVAGMLTIALAFGSILMSCGGDDGGGGNNLVTERVVYTSTDASGNVTEITTEKQYTRAADPDLELSYTLKYNGKVVSQGTVYKSGNELHFEPENGEPFTAKKDGANLTEISEIEIEIDGVVQTLTITSMAGNVAPRTITISGHIDAKVGGAAVPGTIMVFETTKWTGQVATADFDTTGNWSFSIEPYALSKTLYYKVDLDMDDGSIIEFEKSTLLGTVKDSSISGKELTPIALNAPVTLSGTVTATLTGSLTTKNVRIFALTPEYAYQIEDPLPGYLSIAEVDTAGNWSLKVPSFATATEVGIEVKLLPDTAAWIQGSYKQGGSYVQTITNGDISGIALGNVPFVTISGTANVLFNSRPAKYNYMTFSPRDVWLGYMETTIDKTGAFIGVVPANQTYDYRIGAKAKYLDDWADEVTVSVGAAGTVVAGSPVTGVSLGDVNVTN